MAGYVIHLAVAEAYIEKHPEDINDYNKFIEGVIFPDNVSDKSITHYGEKSSKVNLKWFLEENEIKDDYNKGYFLHLVTDYIFYNKLLECFSKDIYNDYDILNQRLQEKFKVKIPESIKKSIFYKEGETKILEIESIIKFIDEVSNYKLSDIKESVFKNDKYWLGYRKLRKI
ncbi:MAG: hypothetical protein HFJ55_00445 [Clostridia bacterium]|nr:hypothetical protein [Clostridia bacterium]